MKKLLFLLLSVGLVFASSNIITKNNTKNNNNKNSVIKSNITNKKLFFISYKLEKEKKLTFAIAVLLDIKNCKYKYLLNYRIGWLYFKIGKYDKSIKYLNKALIFFPNSFEVKILLVRDYIALKNYKLALNILESILRKDYYNYYANYYTAKLLLKEKNFKISKEIIYKMLNFYPSNYRFLKLLEVLSKKTNDKKTYNYVKNILSYY